MDAPIVLVKVDGRLRELHKQLKKDCELEFVTTEDEIGHKTYQRSLSLLLVKAVYHVGGYDKIRHVMLHFSAGSGFFYTVDGDITLKMCIRDRRSRTGYRCFHTGKTAETKHQSHRC